MWKNVFDGLKAAVVLLLLITGVLALPFFLVAIIVIFIGYIVYIVIRNTRIERERKEAHAKTESQQ